MYPGQPVSCKRSVVRSKLPNRPEHGLPLEIESKSQWTKGLEEGLVLSHEYPLWSGFAKLEPGGGSLVFA